jgi:hypothetical protein
MMRSIIVCCRFSIFALCTPLSPLFCLCVALLGVPGEPPSFFFALLVVVAFLALEWHFSLPGITIFVGVARYCLNSEARLSFSPPFFCVLFYLLLL